VCVTVCVCVCVCVCARAHGYGYPRQLRCRGSYCRLDSPTLMTYCAPTSVVMATSTRAVQWPLLSEPSCTHAPQTPTRVSQFAIIVRSLAHFSDYVWVLSTTLALIICVGFDHSTRSPLSHPAHSTATPPVLTGHITHTHRPFQHIPPLDLARSRATQHALTTSRFFCGAGTGCGSRLPFLCGCTPPRSRPPRVSRTSCSARGSARGRSSSTCSA